MVNLRPRQMRKGRRVVMAKSEVDICNEQPKDGTYGRHALNDAVRSLIGQTCSNGVHETSRQAGQ